MGELIGAVVSVLSLTAGYSLGRMRRKTYQPKQIKLKCGCGHTVGFHKNNNNCTWEKWDSWEGRKKRCTCQHYDGPIPYETYVARELT